MKSTYKKKWGNPEANKKTRRFTKTGRYTRDPQRSLAINDNRLFCKRSYVVPNPENPTEPYFFSVTPSTWSWRRIAFILAQLPDFTDFQNLFNQYKIHALKYDFVPQYSENASVPGQQWFGNVMASPRIYTVVDNSGGASVTSEANMLQYSNARLVDGLKPFSIYVKAPNVHLETETTTLFVGATQAAKMWTDLDNPNITFRGCAIGGIMPFGQANSAIHYQCICTAYLEFRQAR